MEDIKSQLKEVSKHCIRLADLFDVELPQLSIHIEEFRKTLKWLDGYIDGLIWKSKPIQNDEDK